MNEAYAAQEIGEALGVTFQTIFKRAEREGWKFLWVAGNGGRQKRFLFAGLPEAVRLAVMRHEMKNVGAGPCACPIEGNHGGLPLQVAGKLVAAPVMMSGWQERVTNLRHDLLCKYIEARNGHNGEGICGAARNFVTAYNTGVLLPHLFKELGPVSVPTLERWRNRAQVGAKDFSPPQPRWGNRRGACKLSEAEQRLLLGFALHPNRLRISQVVRLTVRACQSKSIPVNASEATMRRWLEGWREQHFDHWTFAREGQKSLRDKAIPPIIRDDSLLSVGQVLVADGHKLNFEILNPYTGKPARMALILWFDWASRYPAGWHVMPEENTQCINSALRHAIINLGKIPDAVYLDNGRAFKSKFFTDKNVDFEQLGFRGLFARLGIQMISALPYNARSKVVERFFETFSECERLMPTFTGTSIADKPARLMRNEKLHRAVHEKSTGGFVPTVEQANRMIEAWVEDYARRPHRGLDGKMPITFWEFGKGPGVDEVALNSLMLADETKRVSRSCIKLLGRDYYAPELYGLVCRVVIRYDLEDMSRIQVYEVDSGKFICTAEARQRVHPIAVMGDAEDMETLKSNLREQRRLERGTLLSTREYLRAAPQLVAIPESVGAIHESPLQKRGTPKLTPEEIARIETEGARIAQLSRAQETIPIFRSEAERYEYFFERQFKGREVALQDLAWMRVYERTDNYKLNQGRVEMLMRYWLSEMDEGGERKQ